jgi:hypothetical protein
MTLWPGTNPGAGTKESKVEKSQVGTIESEKAGFNASGERWPTFRGCPECGARMYLATVDESYVGGRGTVRSAFCPTCLTAERAETDEISRLIEIYLPMDDNEVLVGVHTKRKAMLEAIRAIEVAGFQDKMAVEIILDIATDRDIEATCISLTASVIGI